MNPVSTVSDLMRSHYSKTFAQHGPTSEGVDWGSDPARHKLRLEKMLAVLLNNPQKPSVTLLDVGCGYGSLMQLIRDENLPVLYTGIDLCDDMISHAARTYPDAEWMSGDFLELSADDVFDYVVCNGILTQKLTVSIIEMDQFLKCLVEQMFRRCRIGIAFNIMTTHVNFMAPTLYYKNPIELLGWCMSELTSHIKIDHAYPMFEYTVYLYKELRPLTQ